MRTLGLLLVVLGIVGLVLGGIGYDREKTVLDFAGMKATATEHKTIPIAPALAGVALVGGIALLMTQKRRA
jgi:hypothetical protein